MKKVFVLFFVVCLVGCSHTHEQIIGYNEKGQSIVQICHTRGSFSNLSAFGSECIIELRDYGWISNKPMQ